MEANNSITAFSHIFAHTQTHNNSIAMNSIKTVNIQCNANTTICFGNTYRLFRIFIHNAIEVSL